ncbi:MAG: hypothetical protein RSC43_00335 [Clostridia bacterium]
MGTPTQAIMHFSNMVHPTGGFSGHESVITIKNPESLKAVSDALGIKGKDDGETFHMIITALQTQAELLEKFEKTCIINP